MVKIYNEKKEFLFEVTGILVISNWFLINLTYTIESIICDYYLLITNQLFTKLMMWLCYRLSNKHRSQNRKHISLQCRHKQLQHVHEQHESTC